MLYQYKPHPNDPQAAALPYGLRLRVIPGTREGSPTTHRPPPCPMDCA